LPIDQLTLDPFNARTHPRKQLEQLAASIKQFGFNVPVLVDAKRKVIGGHGCTLAAQLIGMTEVPTIRLDHLTEDQRLAFALALNKLAENSTWDAHLLAEQLSALSRVELDFSLEATGFEMGEIDVILEGLEPAHDGEDDSAGALPEATTGVQVSRPRDLWQLGKHRVLCGDALSKESYTALMDGRRAAAVFADPPYNDPIDGYVTGFGKIHHPEFAMASGEMSEADFTEFLSKALSLLAKNSVSGALAFICMDWRHTGELLAAARPVFTEFLNLCVWVKESGGQGSLYRSQHELVFVFKSGRNKHRNNIQLGQYGRYRTNVWQYPRVCSRSRSDEEGGLAAIHPTLKPVALVADAIQDCTARGEIVLDPFLGSGTTVLAAERTGRTCHGMELAPAYVDTTVRRWQAFTGKNAVQATSGRSFNEIEEELRHDSER
jgi:DNA modification methylase